MICGRCSYTPGQKGPTSCDVFGLECYFEEGEERQVPREAKAMQNGAPQRKDFGSVEEWMAAVEAWNAAGRPAAPEDEGADWYQAALPEADPTPPAEDVPAEIVPDESEKAAARDYWLPYKESDDV